jgi:CRP/FNR family nitrogen fixation transcriptional regulator
MQPQVAVHGNIQSKIGWHPELNTAKPATTVPMSDFKALDAFGTVVLVGRDQEVYAEGDAAEYCYKVVAGAIRTLKLMPDGRRQVSEFYLAGDLLGFEDCETRYLTAEAASDATLIRYPRRRIEAQAEADQGLARKLRDLASGSLRNCHKQMLLLGRKSAQERIATFLLEMADRAPQNGDNVVELPMSRSDIADHLGLTLETVSRVLNRLHRDDTINLVSAHRVELADREALEEMGGEA